MNKLLQARGQGKRSKMYLLTYSSKIKPLLSSAGGRKAYMPNFWIRRNDNEKEKRYNQIIRTKITFL